MSLSQSIGNGRPIVCDNSCVSSQTVAPYVSSNDINMMFDGNTDLQVGTFYKCSPSGSQNFEAQGQISIAQGYDHSKGKHFVYVYTCVEDTGAPLITNIQLN